MYPAIPGAHLQGLYENGLSCEAYPHLFGDFGIHLYHMPGHTFQGTGRLSDEVCDAGGDYVLPRRNVPTRQKEFYLNSAVREFQANECKSLSSVLVPLGMSHPIKAHITRC